MNQFDLSNNRDNIFVATADELPKGFTAKEFYSRSYQLFDGMRNATDYLRNLCDRNGSVQTKMVNGIKHYQIRVNLYHVFHFELRRKYHENRR